MMTVTTMTTALSPTTINRTQATQDFLESLLGPIPDDSCLEIRRKRNDEQGSRQEFYTSIADLNLSSFNLHEHCWFGVCLRKRGTRTGRAPDLTWAPVIWLDFDSVQDKDAVVKMLLQFKTPPTHIVDSGGGVHAYFRLDSPVDLKDEAQATLVREIVHGLAHALGADTKVHDLARVMRLVGTFNPGNGTTKTYTPPREVTILHIDEAGRVPLEVLTGFRQPITSRSATPAALPTATTPIDVDQLRVSKRWKKLIRAGWSRGCGYPSRSELDQAVMIAMLRAGHTVEEITAAFSDPADKIGDKYRGKGADGPRYLALTLAAAKEWLATGEAPSRALKLEDGVMKSYRALDGWVVVYTKPIIPVARLRGATDAWQVRVGSENVITLDSASLASAYSLKRALPPVGAWTGGDQDAQKLIPYFEAHTVPEKTSVSVIGQHSDRIVFPNAILGPAGLENPPSCTQGTTGPQRCASPKTGRIALKPSGNCSLVSTSQGRFTPLLAGFWPPLWRPKSAN